MSGGVPPADPAEAAASARGRVVDSLFAAVSLVLAPLVLLVTVVVGLRTGWSTALGALQALLLLAVGAGLLRARAAPGWKQVSLALYAAVSAPIAILHFGPVLALGMVAVLVAVWAGLTMGAKGAWRAAVAVLVLAMLVGVAVTAGLLPRPSGALVTLDDPANWVRLTCTALVGPLVAAWLGLRVIGEYERSAAAADEALRSELEERDLGDQVVQDLHRSQRLETLHRLASGAGHDITNALAVVLCNAELLARSSKGADAELASEILEAARGATKTSRQLLSLGQHETVPGGTSHPKELEERLRRALHRTLPSSVELVVTVETERRVCLHPEAMDRILLNLCLNARDAMPDGGTLSVSFRPVDVGARAGGVAIVVEDTGVGIDDASRDRIFEPFFTTKPASKGTGMGLSIVHGLVTAAGGAISVGARAGGGTVFRIELGPAAAPASMSSRPPARAPMGARLTVLVVEDDARVRAVMKRVLTRAGHTVHEAETGALALDRVATGGPMDLLLTDGVLPDTSTPTVIRAFQRANPDGRVVVCSGYGDAVLEAHGIDLSRCERLPKPFGVAELRRLAEP